jgi:hypothetical protein
MRKPIFVREITPDEQQALTAGLRSADAFTVRRCQILLASQRGLNARQIADQLQCDDQTVRTAMYDFNAKGQAALTSGSSRPNTIHPAFDAEGVERLRALLHRSPRDFDKPTSVWTLDLAAEVAFAEGLTPSLVSGETIRATLARLNVKWRRAKRWITSPDPAYELKKSNEIGSSA